MNTDFARKQMVEQQVRAWDVLDKTVLDCLSVVPREHFVPEAYRSLAFAETEIPLAHGQAMMRPTLEGRLLQSLDLEGDESVLEIGTGSGFLTACLASMASAVTSIDIYADFLDSAHAALGALDISNVSLLEMDGTESLPDGEYDAIAVTGSMQTLDERLVSALKPGGRLFVVTGDSPAMAARLVTRGSGDDRQSVTLFETDLAPLVNGALPPQFSF